MRYYLTDTVTPTSNPQTLFQVAAPTNQTVRILGADISLQGSTPATAPTPLDWIIQTTAGTGSAATGQLEDRGGDDSIRSTMLTDFTAEPTAGSILIEFAIHQQGTAFWRPPFPIKVKGSERVGLRYKSGVYVPVVLTVYLEE